MNKKPVDIVECDFTNPAHNDALVRLMNEYILDKMGGGEPFNSMNKDRLTEGLAKHPSKKVYFAMDNNSFIGLIVCFINFSTFAAKPFINIHDVIVTASWRNSGVGRQMISRIIEVAKEMGCSRVSLEVRADNQNARHLYNSIGFKDADPRQYFWSKYL